MIDDILHEADGKMDKSVEAAREEFAAIRAGRANPSISQSLGPFIFAFWGAAALHPRANDLTEAPEDQEERLSWQRLLLLGTLSLGQAMTNPSSAAASAVSGNQARNVRTERIANRTTVTLENGVDDTR